MSPVIASWRSEYRRPRGCPLKKVQTHLPAPGSTPGYRRSDRQNRLRWTLTRHHNPARAHRDVLGRPERDGQHGGKGKFHFHLA